MDDYEEHLLYVISNNYVLKKTIQLFYKTKDVSKVLWQQNPTRNY